MIQLITQIDKSAMLTKRDLKAAFHHISVHSYNYWLLVFEWNEQYFMNMFLFFELRTAPRIFNLFAETLHWVFEMLYKWNVTHYLDDFLFIFLSHTDISSIFAQFDNVFTEFELTKAIKKDSNDCVIVHLELNLTSRECKFVFSSIKSNVLLMSSSIYSHHLQSHFSCLNQHSISCFIAVKLFFSIAHFCAIFSLKFVVF